MRNYDLKDLHNVMLIITDEIDRICRKHNIKYSMYGGTLIGAVRHGGFIPWDDDFDIAMLRSEYERFIQICYKELDDRFNVISIDNTEDYGYNFIKITLRGTKVLQSKYSKLKDKFSEIWVDVFPMDNVPRNRFRKMIHQIKNYVYIKLLEERFDGISEDEQRKTKILAYRMMGLVNSIVPSSLLKNRLKRNSIRYANDCVDYVTSLSSCYGYDKETLPRAVFDEYIEMVFEGRKYFAVSNYDLWLSNVFGDYMQLPPKEKRITHGFTEIDFGIYKK